MFFSPVKVEVPPQRHVRIFGEALNVAAGHSYIEPVDRGTLNPPGAAVKYSQVSGAANSYFQPEGTDGVLEYGLSDNGTDQVIWSLNQTAFPAYNLGAIFDVIESTKLTVFLQPLQIVGGGLVGGIIGQNVALDEYGRHAFFRIQNTNAGSLFAVAGSNQDDAAESELLRIITGQVLKLELTVHRTGECDFKATKIQTGQTAEWKPSATYNVNTIMNLVFAAEGGGPQKYRIYYWRLDYD